MPNLSSAAQTTPPLPVKELEIHPVAAKEMLDRLADVLLLDVRRQDEYDRTHIPGATLIPLQELEARNHELIDHLDRPIIVYCHHGVRSMNGTIYLRRRGFTNVRSLAGGIEAYSLLADPSVPRY